MSSLVPKKQSLGVLDASNAHVGCHGCQHRVDVRGVAQVVCLAHLAVFSSASGDDCLEFEPKDKPATEEATTVTTATATATATDLPTR